jgi:hypothetical protein
MSSDDRRCPVCDGRARPVAPITVAQLVERPLAAAEGFVFCVNPDCDVVYANGSTGEWLRTDAVVVPVFQKSTDPRRLVCYCFGHRVDDVAEDARLHGRSSIADAITLACRRGLDRCEETNPQGTCCLGNVRAVASQARAGDPTASCCTRADRGNTTES